MLMSGGGIAPNSIFGLPMAGEEGFDLAAQIKTKFATATRLPWSPGYGRLSATGTRVRIPI